MESPSSGTGLGGSFIADEQSHSTASTRPLFCRNLATSVAKLDSFDRANGLKRRNWYHTVGIQGPIHCWRKRFDGNARQFVERMNTRPILPARTTPMRTLLSSCLLIPLLALTNSNGDEPKAKDSSGWRPLFDGKTLDGWEHVGPGKMVVEDGLIRTEGGMGLLWYTREKFGDCVIRVVYKTTAHDANAGRAHPVSRQAQGRLGRRPQGLRGPDLRRAGRLPWHRLDLFAVEDDRAPRQAGGRVEHHGDHAERAASAGRDQWRPGQ